MAGSGSVVTAAGLVFAFTMASFIFSDLRVLGQIGTTIALGLLFDTLIVRSFMTPTIAALLGRSDDRLLRNTSALSESPLPPEAPGPPPSGEPTLPPDKCATLPLGCRRRRSFRCGRIR